MDELAEAQLDIGMRELERKLDVAILHGDANALDVDVTRPERPGSAKVELHLVGPFEQFLDAPERQQEIGADGVNEEQAPEHQGHGAPPARSMATSARLHRRDALSHARPGAKLYRSCLASSRCVCCRRAGGAS